MVVYASLFGVGAPELLVIGAVALMVFGPKGLAEVSCFLSIFGLCFDFSILLKQFLAVHSISIFLLVYFGFTAVF